MVTTTLPQPPTLRSSDLRVAIRAFLSSRETHGIAPGADGNCHAHDLVSTWTRLTDRPMPVALLRQELCAYMCTDQRSADEELGTALLRGDVCLVRLSKRDRR